MKWQCSRYIQSSVSYLLCIQIHFRTFWLLVKVFDICFCIVVWCWVRVEQELCCTLTVHHYACRPRGRGLCYVAWCFNQLSVGCHVLHLFLTSNEARACKVRRCQSPWCSMVQIHNRVTHHIGLIVSGGSMVLLVFTPLWPSSLLLLGSWCKGERTVTMETRRQE